MKLTSKRFPLMLLCLLMALGLAACTDKEDPGKKEDTTLSFGKTSLSLLSGRSEDVTFTTNAVNPVLTLTSNDASVAVALQKSGSEVTVSAVMPGAATITASVNGVSAYISVTVSAPVAGVNVASTVISAAPGGTAVLSGTYTAVETDEFSAVTDSAAVTASVTPGAASSITVTVTASAEAEPGTTVIMGITVGHYAVRRVEIDIVSRGIVYGNGYANNDVFESNHYGLLAKGVDETFPGGKLVFPRRAYYEGYWLPISHIGEASGDKAFPAVIGFANASGNDITAVDTGDTATTVQHEAFKGLNTIESVHIGAGIVGLGDSAFSNEGHYTISGRKITFDGTIKYLTFAENAQITTIGQWTFAGNDLSGCDLVLPDSINLIATRAFSHAGFEVLKMPRGWYKNSGFSLQFYDNFHLKTIYMPWDCFFLVKLKANEAGTGYVYPNPDAEEWQSLKIADCTGGGLIESVFAGKLVFCNNSGRDAGNPLTIYYSGDKELYDNIVTLAGQVGGLWGDSTHQKDVFLKSPYTTTYFNVSYPDTHTEG